MTAGRGVSLGVWVCGRVCYEMAVRAWALECCRQASRSDGVCVCTATEMSRVRACLVQEASSKQGHGCVRAWPQDRQTRGDQLEVVGGRRWQRFLVAAPALDFCLSSRNGTEQLSPARLIACYGHAHRALRSSPGSRLSVGVLSALGPSRRPRNTRLYPGRSRAGAR